MNFHYFLPSTAGEKPSLDLLWFGIGPEVAAPRLTTFLSIFDCPEYSELYGNIEDSLLAALCLLTYIICQVNFNIVLCFFGCFEYLKYTGK